GHSRMLRQHSFDLAQFDTLSLHLYLKIDASHPFNTTVGQIPPKVASTIQPLTGQQIHGKTAFRLLRIVPIALRYSHATDQEFSWNPGWTVFSISVAHMPALVDHGVAVRD